VRVRSASEATYACCQKRRAALARATAVALVVGSLPAAAQAQDPQPQSSTRPADEVPEVVISAKDLGAKGRLDFTPLDFTAARDVIGQEELATSGVLSIQEILRRSPSVTIWDETGSESLPNVALRGVTGNEGASRSINVAMTVDGIPLASAPYGHPGASLFPLVLERVYAVDVQRGGASVRYGPNNVAGVINYLTRPIPTATTFELGTRLDSFQNASQYLGAGGTVDNLGVLVEGVYKDGQTFRDHGDFTLQNYALKLGYAFSEDFRALFQLESFDDDSQLADGLTLAAYQADRFQSTALQNRFTGDQLRSSAKFEWQLASGTRAELVTYWYDSERTFLLGSPTGYVNTPTFLQATPRPMEVWAVQPQVAHEYEFLGAHAELFAGVRYLQEDITRRVERYFPNGTQTVTGDADFDFAATSIFAESTFLTERWRITPGVRFEDVAIDAQDKLAAGQPKFEQDFTEALPALSASYLLDDGWSVYANVQSSFKSPEAQHIELSSDPQDIEAQYAWTYELGTRADVLDERLRADLTLYQIDYRDRIEPNPDALDVFDNIGATRHRGVELAVDGDLSKLAVEGLGAFVTAAWNESEYRNGSFAGNDVVGAPEWLLSWGLRWKHETSGLWAGLDGFFVDESFSDRENTVAINAAGTRGVRPAYTVWNARVGVVRELAEGCTVRATALVRNLLDEEYFEIRAGRGIYAGAPFSYGGELGITFSH